MKYFQMTFMIVSLLSALATAGKATAAEIIVGFSGPISGVASEYGQDLSGGIQLAVDEINAAGGVAAGGQRHTFKLVKRDDHADATQALTIARRFQSEKAIAVFNGVFSTIAPMMKINQEKGHEFLLMAFTSTPAVSVADNKLLICPNTPFTVNVDIYTDWAKAKGYKRCAMVTTVGAYGDEWRRTFRRYWEQKGGIVTEDQPANYYTETDFSAPLTAAISSKPDFMLIGGPSAATALVVEQARMLGFKGGFVFIDQAKQDVVASILGGTELLGDLIAIAGMKTMPAGAARDFAIRYEQKTKRIATWECTVNYVLMHSLARAITAAGTADDAYKIRAAYAKAFPMTLDQFPMEILGVSDNGRWQSFTSLQPMNQGKLDVITQYAWWVKSEEEFQAFSSRSRMKTAGIVQKWHPFSSF